MPLRIEWHKLRLNYHILLNHVFFLSEFQLAVLGIEVIIVVRASSVPYRLFFKGLCNTWLQLVTLKNIVKRIENLLLNSAMSLKVMIWQSTQREDKPLYLLLRRSDRLFCPKPPDPLLEGALHIMMHCKHKSLTS